MSLTGMESNPSQWESQSIAARFVFRIQFMRDSAANKFYELYRTRKHDDVSDNQATC